MSDTPDMLNEAAQLAALRFRVIPIGPGKKHPPLPSWQTAATTDPAIINNWWTGMYRDHGVGIATGYDGLFVVDLDTHGTTNGIATWTALCDQHPELDVTTVTARTGSGGMHIYFIAPEGTEIRNEASRRLGPGIDIRGIGGQVLAPPTIHPNGNRYEWIDGFDPWTVPIADAPTRLIELLTTTPATTAALAPVPAPLHIPTAVTGDDDSPMQWFNRTFTWEQLLTTAGWQHDHTDRNGEQHWTRPGKNGGTSGTVGYQGNDAFHIFTSSIAELLPELDKSMSKFRFYSLMHHNGDDRGAATAIRNLMRPATPFSRNTDFTVTTQPEPTPTTHQALLPDSFWTARPTLTHIRQAAHSRMLAPDGLLGAVLARLAALTNHSWKLPATIGSEAGLDYFSALVGQPGAGKGRSMSVATQLLPAPNRPDWLAGRLFEGPIGSGEGIVRAFYRRKTETDEKGKPVSVTVQDAWNALFRIDEGETLDKLARRNDQTTMTTLRQMFSSEELGATYANEDKNLRVLHYRCGLVMGIQPSRARFLLDDANGGTPARFVWWNLHDPNVPLNGPQWPGPLPWTPPRPQPGAPKHYAPDGTAIDLITIHPDIAHEVRVTRHAFLTNGSDDPLHGHLTLVKLKTAALLAHLEGRTNIDLDDWALAGTIIETSNNVRNGIAQTIRNEDAERTRSSARKAATIRQAELAAEDDHHTGRLEKTILKIVDKVNALGPVAWRDISNLVRADSRLRIEARDAALADTRLIKTSDGKLDIPNRTPAPARVRRA